jgi:predicted esterase
MRTASSMIVLIGLTATACPGADSPATGDGDSSGTAMGSVESTGPGTEDASTDPQTTAPGSDGGESSSAEGTSGMADSTGAGPAGIDPVMPQSTGECPEIVEGEVTFAPAGIPPRQVTLSLAGDHDGASSLVLYWHATGSAPQEAAYSLGATLGEFTGSGGIVAAPHSDPSAGTFEWFLVNGSQQQDDFVLADEIVACLHEAGMIDPARVHSMGMSAGALQTTAFSFLRSSYLASVATYSGGLPGGVEIPDQRPDNPLAALVFFGGGTDTFGPLDFAAASQAYYDALIGGGRFAALCDHGGGHNIPLDAAPSVLEFFAAHPFGTSPSPYAGGLPASFPSYCAL